MIVLNSQQTEKNINKISKKLNSKNINFEFSSNGKNYTELLINWNENKQDIFILYDEFIISKKPAYKGIISTLQFEVLKKESEEKLNEILK